MWANNEVGTIMPIAELAAIAAEFDVPMHSDAVQAVGQLPVGFAASQLSAMSVAAHKFGGPPGAGALLLRRDVGCMPLSHGGGQERDIRSGTPDVAGAVGMATAMQLAVDGLEVNSARLRLLRDRLIDGVLAGVEDTRLNGATGSRRLPGNAHFTFEGCEGDALLMLLDANGIECSTGSACTAGVAQPSHVLIAMGADPASARGSLRLSLGHTSVESDVDAALQVLPGAVARARQAALATAGVVAMRVLAAMSGGVDSSVAAARMVDAGHDVVGVHLALSQAPGTLRTGSRGCCSKEDAGDARRVADVLGIPFYVWDFADRFKEDVIDDFVSSYARGETPNPCVRCNERIKFSALAARALALGFDAVATGHYARLSGGRLRRAVDADKDQSYVLAVLTSDQLRHAAFPIGDTPKSQIRDEAARRGLAVADKPDSHDICFIPSGDTRAFLGERIGVRRGSVIDQGGAVLATHDGVHGFTIGQRKGLGIAGPGPDGRPRYVTAIDADSGTVQVGSAADLEVWQLTGQQPVFTAGTTPAGPVECAVQVRAHGEAVDAVAELAGDELAVRLRAPLSGVAPGQTLVLYRARPRRRRSARQRHHHRIVIKTGLA